MKNNLIRKLLFKIGSKSLALSGLWEGIGSSRRYSDLPRAIGSQDDWLDLYGDREEIISNARAICNLFGLGNRVLKTFSNYVVGDCRVIFNTEDEEWNDLATAYWETQSKLIDVRGVHDFSQIVKKAVIHMIRDGDIGFVKVNLKNGYIAIEAIEADRIGPKQLIYNDPKIIGGIETDTRTGRPIRYWIADRGGYGRFINLRPVPADSFILLYDSMRFDSCRGVSAFAYGALARIRSLRDIIKCEEIGVLTANKWSVAIKASNAVQSFPLPKDYFADESGVLNSQSDLNLPSIENIYDGTIVKLEPGEDITPISSNRPSAAWQGFVDFLIRDIAISMDLPYEFVWDMSKLSGPSVRMMAKQAERTFKNTWQVLENRLMRPIVSWAISNAMQNRILPFNEQFYQFYVQRPELPTIDVGRESKANLEEWNAGLLTGAEICKERGLDIYSVIEQKAREIAYAKEIAKKYGIEPDEIINISKSKTVNSQTPQDNPQEEDNSQEEVEEDNMNNEQENQNLDEENDNENVQS